MSWDSGDLDDEVRELEKEPLVELENMLQPYEEKLYLLHRKEYLIEQYGEAIAKRRLEAADEDRDRPDNWRDEL
jgi:hypothetical protein